MLHSRRFCDFPMLLFMLKFIRKIKNPDAGPHNVALGLAYLAVFGAMLAYSLYWHFAVRADSL
ncbi:MAG: hypothetical protein BHW65_04250 [Verrucomicrobia bacterium CAG:312_58_20]|nr:MAG: hypothetical protein BHW65_04250 [Verrucomicrobia bacterium CAG:312_58_20]